MIAKISNGKNTAKLLVYLYGPGKTNEHTDPHLVTSWDGYAPDPGRSPDAKQAKEQLVQALDLRVRQAGDRAPEQYVWHCSIRAAPEDRRLTDEEWADIAHRIVAATGIAPTGDPDGCRWVAVRHADDHIHIAATKVRGDLRPARHWNDYLTADKELAAIEKEYGLHQVVRGDRTAAQRPTRAEREKAQRTGHHLTPRERLRAAVRTAVSVATSPEEFFTVLSGTGSVLVAIQRFPSGDIRGYKVALQGDTNATGDPIWFSGSKLAPDLSFPQIRERLAAAESQSVGQPHNTPRRPDPWHQATAAAEHIPSLLDRGNDDAAAQAHLAAFGEALDALTLLAPTEARVHLREAATAFERATRSRIRAEHHHARALRSAVRGMRSQPAARDGAALAMFLDAAVLVVMAAARWHRLQQHDQQVAAARRTLLHLEAAYRQAAARPLTSLAQRRPRARVVERHAHLVHQVVPDYAAQIVGDPDWAALTAALNDAEAAGHDPELLLQHAARKRTLDDARSPAQVLTWRIHRLGQRTAPGARARAAQARSVASTHPTNARQTSSVGTIPPGRTAGLRSHR